MELTNLRTMTDLDIAETEEESWLFAYSAFQIDKLHRHNQNFVGMLHARSLLWSTDIKTAVMYLYLLN